VVNEVDDETPPEDFTFITEYHFRNGLSRLDPGARSGCECRPDNGRNVGCEYRSCSCLEDCAVDDNNKPLGFPYHAVGETKGCLRQKYLDRRDVIYECNELCTCPSWCKNKVVQKGRQVPLEIFKTADRGWGLRCTQDLRKGQFIDVYLGEIINDAEAKRRERSSTAKKNSYLFSLDKFFPDGALVVDGEMKGSPARFINHCCDPNVLIYAVSLVRGDPFVYELAFFANEFIPAGTELSFDYLDKDNADEEDESADRGAEKADGGEGLEDGRIKCRCGAPNCRRWLWM
jgi:histone-lysine N-methyltransferase SUV39H